MRRANNVLLFSVSIMAQFQVSSYTVLKLETPEILFNIKDLTNILPWQSDVSF